jgi:hypothetical protein
MRMIFDDWVKNGWLKIRHTDPSQIRDLLDTIKSDYENSLNESLSLDWQFKIAYNSILNCGIAALAAEGYRSASESHHYWIIQSLAHTLKIDGDIIDLLDDFRKKRNMSAYERSGRITKREVNEIIELSKMIQYQLIEWLRENHRDLI